MPFEVLASVAGHLEPILPDVTFVGGQVAPLLMTAVPSTSPRVTYDVDLVVGTATRVELHRLGDRLRELGLRNDVRPGAPAERWLTPEDIAVDVMPASGDVLGFSNRWYPDIVDSAEPFPLTESLTIRIPPAPLFIASKWDAFDDRGENDPASPDLEDIVSVVAGRPEVVSEIEASPPELRTWLASRARRFLEGDLVDYAIPGVLGNTRLIPDIVPIVRRRFERIADFEQL